MRALVIGHDHVAGTGHLGVALEAAGYTPTMLTIVPEHRFATPWVEVEYPDPAAWDLVVTLGAPWPRERTRSWAEKERDVLARAHSGGVPVLGVCFGAQLLAEALGGGTRRLPVPRVGWFPVESRTAGVDPGPWFHWQADAIVAPPGADMLAGSADDVAAFRVGRSAGVGFHPEMTPELLGRWFDASGGGDRPAARDLAAATRARSGSAGTKVPALVTTLLGR